jgi:hypothetical protein
LFLDREKFPASFAADVKPEVARFMADSQVPWGVKALEGTVTTPAWKSKPSCYLVATSDKMIPPPAQRSTSRAAVPAFRGHRVHVVRNADGTLRVPRLTVNDASPENGWCEPCHGLDEAIVRDLHRGGLSPLCES